MINDIYKEEKVMKSLKKAYSINTPQGLQITSFLKDEGYIKFLKSVDNSKFKKKEIMDQYSFFEAQNQDLKIFNNKEFLKFASSLIGKKFTKSACSLRMFMHRSFTLMNDKSVRNSYEFYFDLTPKWEDSWGGYIAYMTDEGNKIITPQHPNSIIFAVGNMSYVKYVNSSSKSNGRLLVYGRLK